MAKVIEFPRIHKFPINEISISAIEEIPIVRQALFFLSEVAVSNGVKLTVNGNLGRNFVQKFWEEVVEKDRLSFRPHRQDDCLDVQRIQFLLKELGYVEIEGRKLQITKIGRSVLEEGPTAHLFRSLFEVGVFSWNWQYGDRYPEYDFIQNAYRTLFDSLWGDCDPLINAIDIFEKSFSTRDKQGVNINIRKAVRRENLTGMMQISTRIHCLQLRFMVRFCLPFGLLIQPSKGSLFSINQKFEKTQFLTKDFHGLVCSIIHGPPPEEIDWH